MGRVAGSLCEGPQIHLEKLPPESSANQHTLQLSRASWNRTFFVEVFVLVQTGQQQLPV